MKHNFKNLEIWVLSRNLVREIYTICRQYPQEERYGLISQTQRSAVSVPSNIAEGCGRDTDKQLRYFLNVAIGSLCELETQIYLATDLNYINKENQNNLVKLISQIRRMTIGFQTKLRQD